MVATQIKPATASLGQPSDLLRVSVGHSAGFQPMKPTKRGRPPHQDVLTPAEWRVLSYLQLGRANAQIAAQLDVSITTVRYHVANLLAKSGLANRRELAAWRPLGLSGARLEAPSFRGDRFAAVRTLLSQIGVDGLGASPLDIIHGVQDIEPETSADPAPVTLFTGTVVGVGEVIGNDGGLLKLDAAALLPDIHPGDWVAVNGVALVVAPLAVSEDHLVFTLPEPILRRTNIGALKPGTALQPGSAVNLEPAARVTDRMSGHILGGETDGTASLRGLDPEGEAVIATYEAAPDLLRYIVEKGRVSVDGVSLAVIDRTITGFSVSLVPFTRARTNLATRRLGEQVNIETDVLARYVERLIQLADQLATPRSNTASNAVPDAGCHA
jgi:riboflavin synthase